MTVKVIELQKDEFTVRSDRQLEINFLSILINFHSSSHHQLTIWQESIELHNLCAISKMLTGMSRPGRRHL
ncbi:hypothetical protein T02_13358 [Trichinella nativa]|uniref:Uncharacterized protein n=1 Tax=Trichinella nativa TaxID=6335 RepID=A0A0V1L309_9BILA|nr:hypothetical protein T02_13358 [Trichinella nativa]